MKRIALILLLVSFAYPQNRVVKSFILKYANTQNGTQLNGTTQYWYNATPSANVQSGSASASENISIIAIVDSAVGGIQGVVSTKDGTGSNTDGYHLYYQSTTWRFQLGDGAANKQAVVTAPAITTLLIVSADRTGNVTVYANGVAGTPVAMSGLGDCTASAALSIGLLSRSAPTYYYAGKLGFIQIIKGYALTDSDVARLQAQYKSGNLPVYYGTGTTVALYDWQSGGFDESGNGNHLTKVNDPIIVKVKQ